MFCCTKDSLETETPRPLMVCYIPDLISYNVYEEKPRQLVSFYCDLNQSTHIRLHERVFN